MAISYEKFEKYRVRRNLEHDALYKYLIQDLNVFQNYPQLITISSIIGYLNGPEYCIPFDKSAETVQLQFFSERSRDLIDFIAYAHKKEQAILTSIDEEKFHIFEGYANGGFNILIQKLGIDVVDKTKNDRLEILRKYYILLLMEDYKL